MKHRRVGPRVSRKTRDGAGYSLTMFSSPRDRNAGPMNDNPSGSFIELTADIVSAYVSNNSVSAGEISSLIN